MSLDFYNQKWNQQTKRIWVAFLSKSIIEGNQSINQSKNLERKVWRNAAYWLMLNLPSYTTQDHLLSDSTNHFGQSQDNFPQKCHLIWAIP